MVRTMPFILVCLALIFYIKLFFHNSPPKIIWESSYTFKKVLRFLTRSVWQRNLLIAMFRWVFPFYDWWAKLGFRKYWENSIFWNLARPLILIRKASAGPWSIGSFVATLTYFLATLKVFFKIAIFETKMLQKNVARNLTNRPTVAMSMLQGF